MITYLLSALGSCDHIDSIFIVAAEKWQSEIIKDFDEAGVPRDKIGGFAKPGETRQLSIVSGLRAIIYGEFYPVSNGRGIETANETDTVLICDAARPFISNELLDNIFSSLKNHDGVMPVLPMKDTIYRSHDGRSISSLEKREELFAGQAPELFNLREYYDANFSLMPDRIKKINGSSEPALIAGLDIAMIPGDERNFKVTSSQDVEHFIAMTEHLN